MSKSPLSSQFGSFCRTRAYRHAIAPQLKTWHEAHENPLTKRWSVIEVRFDGNKEEREETVTPLIQDVEYQDALNKLSEFEISSVAMQFELADPDHDLGISYFKSLAERDGIIFDADGKAHYCINGFIGDLSGTFSANARLSLMQNYGKKPKDIEKREAQKVSSSLTVLLNRALNPRAQDKNVTAADGLCLAFNKEIRDIKMLATLYRYLEIACEELAKIPECRSENVNLSGHRIPLATGTKYWTAIGASNRVPFEKDLCAEYSDQYKWRFYGAGIVTEYIDAVRKELKKMGYSQDDPITQVFERDAFELEAKASLLQIR